MTTIRAATRRSAVMAMTFVLATSAAAELTLGRTPSAAAPDTPLAPLERQVVDAVNEVRRDRKLPALAHDPELAEIARRHSCAMAERGFFEHTDPDGGSMAERLAQARKKFRAAGENLARIESRDPAARAVAGWMKSTGHRENMLSPRFTTTGVGACRGGRAVYFTQLFLRPR
jgi:uncharacterized protein YkwD